MSSIKPTTVPLSGVGSGVAMFAAGFAQEQLDYMRARLVAALRGGVK